MICKYNSNKAHENQASRGINIYENRMYFRTARLQSSSGWEAFTHLASQTAGPASLFIGGEASLALNQICILRARRLKSCKHTVLYN